MRDLSDCGIDTDDGGRRAKLEQCVREDSGASTYIEPACVRRRRQPLQKDVRDRAAPAPHRPLVRRAVIEVERVLGHALLRVETGLLGELGIQNDLVFDVRRKLGRRHDHRIDAKRCELVANLGRLQGL